MWQHMERASGGNMADPIWSGPDGQPGAKRNGLQMYSRWRGEGDKKAECLVKWRFERAPRAPPQLVNHSMWAASNRFPPSSFRATQIEDNGWRDRKGPGKSGRMECPSHNCSKNLPTTGDFDLWNSPFRQEAVSPCRPILQETRALSLG